MRTACKFCGLDMITPSGSPSALLHLVGAMPGWDEIRKGVPWIGPAGEVLKAELRRAGIATSYCRLSNIWRHQPNEDMADRDYQVDLLLKDLKGAKAVLLMGSLPAQLLLQQSIVDCSGLIVKTPKIFPSSVKVVVAMFNPASALQDNGVVGELRIGMKKFADATREWRR